MTKYNVGDKVQILDVDAINFGQRYFSTGDITEVTRVDSTGCPFLKRVKSRKHGANGDDLLIVPDEFRAIELVQEESFQVGDKVRLLSGGGAFPLYGFHDGEIYEVKKLKPNHDIKGVIQIVRYDELLDTHYHGYAFPSRLEKVEEQPATKFQVGDKVRLTKEFYEHDKGKVGTITAVDADDIELTYQLDGQGWVNDKVIELYTDIEDELEALIKRLDELEAKIVELEVAQQVDTDEQDEPTSDEKNEPRKKVIENAKKFVEETIETVRDYHAPDRGNATYCEWLSRVEFVVNEKKRTVVAIVRRLHGDKILNKGIAKCHDSDVFNADIGKAIAMGRAYGLDVSEFEQAPQPKGIAPGMIVESLDYGKQYEVSGILNPEGLFGGHKYGTPFSMVGYSSWLGEKQVHIISDSNAEY